MLECLFGPWHPKATHNTDDIERLSWAVARDTCAVSRTSRDALGDDWGCGGQWADEPGARARVAHVSGYVRGEARAASEAHADSQDVFVTAHMVCRCARVPRLLLGWQWSDECAAHTGIARVPGEVGGQVRAHPRCARVRADVFTVLGTVRARGRHRPFGWGCAPRVRERDSRHMRGHRRWHQRRFGNTGRHHHGVGVRARMGIPAMVAVDGVSGAGLAGRTQGVGGVPVAGQDAEGGATGSADGGRRGQRWTVVRLWRCCSACHERCRASLGQPARPADGQRGLCNTTTPFAWVRDAQRRLQGARARDHLQERWTVTRLGAG